MVSMSLDRNCTNEYIIFICRYPIYQKGNPQLRVFLPNFWMKLVKPITEAPPNMVQFACSMEMTKRDVRNYLEKIYNVNVAHVRTRIALGKTRRDPGKGYVVKDDDIKYAYVVLVSDIKCLMFFFLFLTSY